jgi:hypothetical protein
MAKKKSGKPAPAPKLKPDNYVVKNGRKFPVEDCLLSEQWQERGLAVVIVKRRKPNGNLLVGIYMVDTFCLGVKDSHYYLDMSDYDFEEFLKDYSNRSDLKFEKTEPEFAYNLIYGAMEYAEDLGFAPNKSFRVTEHILKPVEEVDYMEIAFGRDGRPFYVVGPKDNMDFILDQLDASVGEGNYDFYSPFHDEDYYEDDDEDYKDEDEEFADFEEVGKEFANRMAQSYDNQRFDNVYDMDEDDIIDFSEAEYARESASLRSNIFAFNADTFLADVYAKATDNGKKELDKALENHIFSQFSRFVKEQSASENAAETDKFLAHEGTRDRVNYSIYNFQDFLKTRKAEKVALKDYVLSAYIRFA